MAAKNDNTEPLLHDINARLAYLMEEIEGEAVQEIHQILRDYPLDESLCEKDDKGKLIPRTQDVWCMKVILINYFKDRHKRQKELLASIKKTEESSESFEKKYPYTCDKIYGR